eukprot:s5762_g2.t1
MSRLSDAEWDLTGRDSMSFLGVLWPSSGWTSFNLCSNDMESCFTCNATLTVKQSGEGCLEGAEPGFKHIFFMTEGDATKNLISKNMIKKLPTADSQNVPWPWLNLRIYFYTFLIRMDTYWYWVWLTSSHQYFPMSGMPRFEAWYFCDFHVIAMLAYVKQDEVRVRAAKRSRELGAEILEWLRAEQTAVEADLAEDATELAAIDQPESAATDDGA